MAIPINLKQILQSDTSAERLDKINYNFDQLIANGGGPMGTPGLIGDTGAAGLTGNQGIDGPQGYQGNQGPVADLTESKWRTANQFTNGQLKILNISPVHDISQGITTTPPIVILGLANSDSEYLNPGNTSTNASFYKSSLVINKNSSILESNIRLITEKDTLNFVDFNLDLSIAGENRFYIGFNPSSSSVSTNRFVFQADEFGIVDAGGSQKVKITSVGTFFTGSFTSDGDATFNSPTFKISTIDPTGIYNPAAGKIAVALDSAGTIGWMDPTDIGAGVPIGTITSMLEEIFYDSNNFIKTQDFSSFTTTDPWELDIEIGRGVVGTAYEGWYLCNGKTWQNGTASYTVPNLSSFQFLVSSNGSTSSNISSDGVENILGGGQVNVFNPTASTHTMFIDTSSDTIFPLSSATNTDPTNTAYSPEYRIVRTPQLIYLGLSDLTFNVPAATAQLVYVDSSINSSSEVAFTTSYTFADYNAGSISDLEVRLNPDAVGDYNNHYVTSWSIQYGVVAGANTSLNHDVSTQFSSGTGTWSRHLSKLAPSFPSNPSVAYGQSSSAKTYIVTFTTNLGATADFQVIVPGEAASSNNLPIGTVHEWDNESTVVPSLNNGAVIDIPFNSNSANISSYTIDTYAGTSTTQDIQPTGIFWIGTTSTVINALAGTGYFRMTPASYISRSSSAMAARNVWLKLKDENGNHADWIRVYQDQEITIAWNPVTYSSAIQTGYANKNNCANGISGSLVAYTVAAGAYTSTVSQAAANQQALNDVNTNKQAYANLHGTCQTIIRDFFPSCFVAGSKVKVYAENGFLDVNIEDVQIGDKVLGRNNVLNTVLEYDRPLLSNRKLYDINKNNDYFVSEEHPMLTKKGWKSLKPEYIQKYEIEIWEELFEGRDDVQLAVGDEMVMYDGTFTVINSLDVKEADFYTQLYNFNLDGDNTYVVNNYVVHNT